MMNNLKQACCEVLHRISAQGLWINIYIFQSRENSLDNGICVFELVHFQPKSGVKYFPTNRRNKQLYKPFAVYSDVNIVIKPLLVVFTALRRRHLCSKTNILTSIVQSPIPAVALSPTLILLPQVHRNYHVVVDISKSTFSVQDSSVDWQICDYTKKAPANSFTPDNKSMLHSTSETLPSPGLWTYLIMSKMSRYSMMLTKSSSGRSRILSW